MRSGREIAKRLFWSALLPLKQTTDRLYLSRIPDTITLDIPYFCQFGSTDKAELFALRKIGLHTDPNWNRTGADTVAEYCFWASHCCGMACLKMAMATAYSDLSIIALAKLCQQYGGYVCQNGQIADPGLHYRPFIRFLKNEFNWESRAYGVMTIPDIHREITKGRYVMVSVHPAIGHVDSTPPRKGGHLVLITGYSRKAGTLRYHDPAGPLHRQQHVTIANEDFNRFFAHKGLAFGPRIPKNRSIHSLMTILQKSRIMRPNKHIV